MTHSTHAPIDATRRHRDRRRLPLYASGASLLCVAAMACTVTRPSADLTTHGANPAAAADRYADVYRNDWRAGLPRELALQEADPSGVTVVPDPVDPTARAVLASVRQGENFARVANGSPRAEITFANAWRFRPGHDYLIRWRTYTPRGFHVEPNQALVITQIHQGSLSGPPPVELDIQGNQYVFAERGGPHGGNRTPLCCVTSDAGKWVDWTLRYVPDPLGKHASTRLWKNGVLQYTSDGRPNAYPDDTSSYLKMGIYLPFGWKPASGAASGFAVFFGPVSVQARNVR